jgi:hypothetical protein
LSRDGEVYFESDLSYTSYVESIDAFQTPQGLVGAYGIHQSEYLPAFVMGLQKIWLAPGEGLVACTATGRLFERTAGVVANESGSWSRIKALYR